MKPIQTILVPTDLSEDAVQVLALAIDLARRHDAAIQVVYIRGGMEDDAWSPLRLSPEQAVLHESPERMMRDLIDTRLQDVDTTSVRIEVDAPHSSSVTAGILTYAKKYDADLIVMATHARRGMRRWLHSSAAVDVVREAPCPVLVVRPDTVLPGATFERILVAVDFAAHSEPALAYATTLAQSFGARLVLLHVLEGFPTPDLYGPEFSAMQDVTPEMEARAREEMQRIIERLVAPEVQTEPHFLTGYPPDTILDVAREQAVDLLVLGTHGRTGFDRFVLGSVAESLVRKAPCPVLIAKPSNRLQEASPSSSTLAE